MEHILEPNASFDFSRLNFISPASLSGGVYFIRILTSAQQPFYIQTPKCYTKQGVMKSGKKLLCDLVFKHEDESFLEFLECLENFCQKQIFDNREKWFESGLSMVDIENCFASPTKTFKSGKMHLMRTNVPVRLGKCNLKIFDEQEQDLAVESLKENTSVVSIMEIQGIRCSARSFQIEFEVKQMMVLKPVEDIFEKCILGRPLVKKQEEPLVPISDTIKPVSEIVIQKETDTLTEDTNDELVDEQAVEADQNEEMPIDKDDIKLIDAQPEAVSEEERGDGSELEENFELVSEGEVLKDLEETEVDSNVLDESLEKSGLCEVTLEVPEEEEPIKLKNPNEVYFEMYKEAKRKAQIARDLAISSYLSAKQIKHNYLNEESFSDDEEMVSQEQELKDLEFEEETN